MEESPFQHTTKAASKPEPMEVKEEPQDAKTPKTSKKSMAITVEQIQEDKITELAVENWGPEAKRKGVPFRPEIVEQIYAKEMIASNFSTKRIMMLEFSRYLENYLWPHYSKNKTSKSHIMSIAAVINEKFRERVPSWEAFKSAPEDFSQLFRQVLELCLSPSALVYKETTVILIFLIHCFNSLEVDLIRDRVQRLVSLPIWINLLPGRREALFKNNPKYKKFFNAFKKRDAKLSPEELNTVQFERNFLARLIEKFYSILDSIPLKGHADYNKVHYCERFLELLIDTEAQLPTRRFVNTLLDDRHVVVRCKLSQLILRKEGKLFSQLLSMLESYAHFEIDDITGEALNMHDRIDIHYNRVNALQTVVFKHYPDLQSFAIKNVASVDSKQSLIKYFEPLSSEDLHTILAHLNYLPPLESDVSPYSKSFLMELLIWKHERMRSQQEAINEMPLYPTENIIWDENVVPSEFFSGEGCLALPKLNLQFLTLHDYLLRNFNLFRLESTYEIRQDIEDALTHLKPWKAEDGHCLFGGWARMAQPIHAFNVVEVAKPQLGENHPAQVRADVTVNLSVRQEVKHEWEGLRKHDVAFLITLRPDVPIGYRYNHTKPFIPQVGLTYVRGCEIEGLLDETGKLIEEGPEPKPEFFSDNRTYRVWLDPNQYQMDMTRTVNGEEDVYETFNVMMRRKPKENNFKAVLETIRDLMNTECVVPDWLHDLILGYGDPDSAHYSKMPNTKATLDWNDTFLSLEHLKSSYHQHKMEVEGEPEKQVPPYRLTFQENSQEGKRGLESDENKEGSKVVKAVPHIIPNRGPYPYNMPKKNSIQFTPTQIEAIRAGMQPGLTMVVGPPGTGKTDVAVQIISNIYHNFPSQRMLVVTHSNQALNQLFEKIMALDVDERHLLRLGHGEEALETEKDFSRYGRVNYVLAQRLELLQEVNRLQVSLDEMGDMSYTCETAGYFYIYQVLSRWEEFQIKIKPFMGQDEHMKKIQELFPFVKFFANAPQPLFRGKTFAENMNIAEGCFRHIKKIFTQLEEFRAFELLRSGSDRANYLLMKEAKIIAMTCTHAALKRRDLVTVGFQFDNIIMEESAQILEIETFIPLLLQNPKDGNNRLKRWIMIGDHHQLPPVIKNMAFQKFSNMEQSLFTRLVRLGVPTVDLDAQGRARASLANLYNWRYKKLGSLPHVLIRPEFRMANAGFQFEYQLIDVGDFNGMGESEPNPYFYQNLAEAEYVVAVFMYMRMIGYPGEQISILTTYNGQKHLIRDVIQQRCGGNPLIGRPHKVTTVDRYQGQQNNFILLSLVRTRAVGHLRDVRRLIVAMSRARLGLYVFARSSLFSNCFELTPAFNKLTSRPQVLHLLPNETYPTQRKLQEAPDESPIVITDMPQMAQFVYDFYNARVDDLKRHRGFLKANRLQAPPKKQVRSSDDS
ncbi:RNA helicase aquarius [Aplysia californica]|uniref:RNA helicase aquarius n=1 Tax=Aplysia californica TaxID=6500 RepID=A0ABM0K5J8_APLCA|nr:RNA helicase aquarius [Aplysia californica]XP_005109243.1 RNA helicase aquarius [Aplysia californica]